MATIDFREYEKLQRQLAELQAAVESLVCGSCKNRIGWTGPPHKEGFMWENCTSCGKIRRLIGRTERTDGAS